MKKKIILLCEEGRLYDFISLLGRQFSKEEKAEALESGDYDGIPIQSKGDDVYLQLRGYVFPYDNGMTALGYGFFTGVTQTKNN